MADNEHVEEITVSDFHELRQNLYAIAVRHRETFEGMAVSVDGGADIFVRASEDGVPFRYVFRNPNPNSMASFHRQLLGAGYLNGRLILHEDIISDVEQEEQLHQEAAREAMAAMHRYKAEKHKEARVQKTAELKWWAAFLIPLSISTILGVITILTSVYLVPSGQDQKIRSLEQRIEGIEKHNPAVAAPRNPEEQASIEDRPTTQPVPRN